MKKTLLIVSLFLLGPFAIFAQELQTQPANTVTTKLDNLNLVIDARLEFLTVLQYLTGSFYIVHNDTPYCKALESSFAPFKNHPDLNFVKRIFFESGKNAEVPHQVMLGLDYDFTPFIHTQESISRKIHSSPDTVSLLLKTMAKLAKETRFYDFFNAQRPFYKSINRAFTEKISGVDLTHIMEDFYGESHDIYSLFIKPLDLSSYGLPVPDSLGFDHAGLIYGFAEAAPEHLPNEVDLSVVIWHEFGHTFINRITKAHNSIVEGTKHLYNPISKVKYAYPKWNMALNEQIIRSITTYFAYRHFGEESSGRMLRKEQGQGFYYTSGLSSLLMFYEENRERYPAFTDYFPDFMEKFSILAPDNLAIIPTRYFMSLDSAYVIIPCEALTLLSEEDMPNISKSLGCKNLKFIDPDQAQNTDLSQRPVIAFVNLKKGDNKWLLNQFPQLPFRFGENTIELCGENITGDNLRTFVTWKNPSNEKKDALYFIANNSSDVKEILEHYIMFMNFGIWEGKKWRASGTFYNKNGQWEIDQFFQ